MTHNAADIEAKNSENIDRLAAILAVGKPVVFLTGAGLSVSSGITPYRYSSEAIWSRFVQDQGTRKQFKRDSTSYWNDFWLRTHEKPEFLNAKPNEGHFAISNIIHKCPNCRVVTQNIDCLHTKSGIDSDRLAEVHGSLGKYKCLNNRCPLATSQHGVVRSLDDYALGNTNMATGNLRVKPPRCPLCQTPMMPLTLMFDEQYNSHDEFGYQKAEKWFSSAAAIVFVGTSLSVRITTDAAILSQKNNAELYNFNVMIDDRQVGQKWVIGKAEQTLVMLYEKLCEKLIVNEGGDNKKRMRMCAFLEDEEINQ